MRQILCLGRQTTVGVILCTLQLTLCLTRFSAPFQNPFPVAPPSACTCRSTFPRALTLRPSSVNQLVTFSVVSQFWSCSPFCSKDFTHLQQQVFMAKLHPYNNSALSISPLQFSQRHWCCVLTVYSGVPGFYVNVPKVSKGSWVYFWVAQRTFKFPAKTCCDPVEKQPDQWAVTPLGGWKRRDSSPLELVAEAHA